MSQYLKFCIALSVWVLGSQLVMGQQSEKQEIAAREFKKLIKAKGSKQLSEKVRQLALAYLPKEYKDEKEWGKQKEITRYLPKKRKVKKNHGRWRRYVLKPVQPEQSLKVDISELLITPLKTTFRLKVRMKLDLMARQAQWLRGVQIYSFHIDASADLEIDLLCEVKVQYDLFGKDRRISLSPVVHTAKSMIHDFRVHRISNVGGEIAQQLTKAAKKWLKKNQERYDTKLKDKINRSIEKKKDRLQLKW